MATQVNKDMIIAELLEIGGQEVAKILMMSGMHCIGCPSAQGETLAEAAEVHGMNADEIVTKINDYLKTV